MKQIYLPSATFFGLKPEKILEIESKIRSSHLKYVPVRLPPPIISDVLKQKMIEDSLFLTEMIFNIPDKIFAGNPRKLAEALRVDQQLGDLIERLSKKEWNERAKKFYRPDFLLTESGLQMVENNIDTPLGGIGLCDAVITKFQMSGDISESFLQEKNLYHLSIDEQWSHTLKKLLSKKKSSLNQKPVFFSAYHSENVDPADDFTTPDYNNAIINNGFTLLCGPLSALEIRDHKVTFQGTEIDIVYTDFSFTEFIENNQPMAIIDALISADENSAVLYLSPPSSMLYDNKAVLAFLTNDEYKDFFTAPEWNRLSQLVPDTRIVNDHSREYCIKNRENLVLKPGFDFGGRNVFFGADQTENAWNSMIKAASQTLLPTVVQQVVTNQVKIYDSESDKSVHFCLSPLFFDNVFAGCLYRESVEHDSKNPVINASRGSKFSSVYFNSLI